MESIYIKGEPEKNIFLLGKSLLGTAKIGKLSTGCCEFLCFKSQNGALAVSLEGNGGKAKIKNA